MVRKRELVDEVGGRVFDIPFCLFLLDLLPGNLDGNSGADDLANRGALLAPGLWRLYSGLFYRAMAYGPWLCSTFSAPLSGTESRAICDGNADGRQGSADGYNHRTGD